jgi:hypothetical protein
MNYRMQCTIAAALHWLLWLNLGSASLTSTIALLLDMQASVQSVTYHIEAQTLPSRQILRILLETVNRGNEPLKSCESSPGRGAVHICR